MKGRDLKTNSEIRCFSIPMDEPRELGGDDTGPNPQLTDLVEKHCPVYDTLRRPVAVKGKVELVRPFDPVGSVTIVFETD
ncbi:MAG: OsmC family protein [Desulfobacteria bacterium]